MRHGLNVDLGFSADDRAENVRRIAHVAQLLADAGVVALVPVISPYRAGRQFARDIHAAAELPFVEVWVSTPIEECEKRDPKGLYVKARAGELTGFTGIDDAVRGARVARAGAALAPADRRRVGRAGPARAALTCALRPRLRNVG